MSSSFLILSHLTLNVPTPLISQLEGNTYAVVRILKEVISYMHLTAFHFDQKSKHVPLGTEVTSDNWIPSAKLFSKR